MVKLPQLRFGIYRSQPIHDSYNSQYNKLPNPVLYHGVGMEENEHQWGALMGLAFGFLGAYTQGHFEFNVYSGMLDGFNNFLGILAGGIILGAWIKIEN